MSSLKTIIRLQKWKLDEKRRALAELQSLADRLQAEIERLKEEIAAERDTARGNVEYAFTYSNYIQAAMERGKRLTQSMGQVEAQIAVATDEMAEAFQELKRYELAEEERLKREKEKLKRKEANMLDETALVGFRRRQQEESSVES
ncbi:flagellar FliJ family protein [Azospirillum sp. YIM DDC1]|uniref:Flagellar FliJ protein n=1 Tax=Azospirillum aestuarii TaxID=2802052 RepID=A0ABS1HRP5_9PROT|nr:flagellar FliJ family protein [Azospirillum aestuarii]MBK4717349.1 flagellar FliJ family protein [Azospirillum aestuarii]